MRIVAIIPARYASTRFEGKPLVDIGGKTMIERVYNQVIQSAVDAAYIATDDERIYDEAKRIGANVLMTKSTHQSGTDRCAEAIAILSDQGQCFDLVLNVQGDEPFIQPSQINELIAVFNNSNHAKIGTLVRLIQDKELIQNPNIVKVVFDDKMQALYFSRHPIPYIRNQDGQRHDFYKHIGMYAFRTNILLAVAKLKPSSLELAESLEQLRWLQAGYSIHVALTEKETLGIDTPEDLEKAREIYQQHL